MSDLWGKMRSLARRVAVKDIKDDGETQTASIEVAPGIWREGIEVAQQYGVSSSAPEDGALAIALALGADEGDMVLLPISNPSKRMGGLGARDAALYNAHGDMVVVRAGGGVEVKAASSFSARIGGVTFTVSSGGVDINGGHLKVNGVRVDETHKHGNVLNGSGTSGTPVA